MTRWEELGMTAEEYVRSHWDVVEIHHGLVDQDTYGYWVTVRGRFKSVSEESKEPAYTLAAGFTAAHENTIRWKREEVNLVRKFIQFREGEHLAYAGSQAFQAEMTADAEVFRRILAVLESQLAALLNGWKEKS